MVIISVVRLITIMMNVVYAGCRYAQCHYGECRYVGFREYHSAPLWVSPDIISIH
jgi:hypothetical protein